ncbi:unnamed protein product [Notodromas monacha]|uniref:Amidophosphoribosyltransferase n=1 Tax=Notodromas monacha TaxID=399045 RepID=A0A7R9BJM0_9CRUS|nr:unnamed protein product [Notodromas monacha]CAG0916674.1 unnamed protein product [Notodromas monacha]
MGGLGQESAGIVTSDGSEAELKLHKGHGLVSSIFSEDLLYKLQGNLGIGHTRYSTVGGHQDNSNVQPFVVHTQEGPVAVAHNGELVNAKSLRKLVYSKGVGLARNLGIGHTRYSTVGGHQDNSNVQPFVVHTQEGPVAVAHNGELVNAKSLRKLVYSKGVGLASLSDSELITQLICLQPESSENNWPDRIKTLMHMSPISYSLVIMHNDAIYAVRDPYGNRPLSIGRILKNGSVSRSSSFLFKMHENPDSAPATNGNATPLSPDTEETEAWVVASESCAFRAVGAEFVREVAPGEMVEVSKYGLKSTFPLGDATPNPSSLCIFEYVYFSRPDSWMEGQQIWGVRRRCGIQLAKESPCKVDLVSTVPESATPAAMGFAEACGIPFTEVFCKNRQVHIRIASPPIKFPCRMGIHIPTKSELIANNKEADKLAEEIGAASLKYLTVEGLVQAVSSHAKPQGATPTPFAVASKLKSISENGAIPKCLNGASNGSGENGNNKCCSTGLSRQDSGDPQTAGYCTACLTGKYPVALEW